MSCYINHNLHNKTNYLNTHITTLTHIRTTNSYCNVCSSPMVLGYYISEHWTNGKGSSHTHTKYFQISYVILTEYLSDMSYNLINKLKLWYSNLLLSAFVVRCCNIDVRTVQSIIMTSLQVYTKLDFVNKSNFADQIHETSSEQAWIGSTGSEVYQAVKQWIEFGLHKK